MRAPEAGTLSTFWYAPPVTMPGAIGIDMPPAVSLMVAVTTNCFGRPSDAFVSGSTSFTPAMLITSPALRVVRPDAQPLVTSVKVDTNALPAPGFDWPAPFTAGAAVVLNWPQTCVGSLVLRKQT